MNHIVNLGLLILFRYSLLHMHCVKDFASDNDFYEMSIHEKKTLSGTYA